MMATGVRWLGIAVLAALASGCATLQTGSYLAREAEIGRYRTFAWGPADAAATGDPRLDSNELFERRVRAEVERALARRGFEKAMVGDPDLLVHYHASVGQRVDVRDLDRGLQTCEDDACGPFVYDSGTLFVDLVDARASRLIWRGWAEGNVDGVIDHQDALNARIEEAVLRIFSRFPGD